MDKPLLIAERGEDVLTIKGSERTQRFHEIIAGVGYGDPNKEGAYAKYAAVVIGWQTDDRLNVIDEFIGTFPALGYTLTDFKDQYKIESIYVDSRFKEYRKRLNDTEEFDGLSGYDKWGSSSDGYAHPPSEWTYFVGRNCVANILPVSKAILKSYDEAINQLRTLIEDNELLVAPWCTKMGLLTKETHKKGKDHPLIKALVYGALSLFESQLVERGGGGEPLGRPPQRFSWR
jgi:hypothetical protein